MDNYSYTNESQLLSSGDEKQAFGADDEKEEAKILRRRGDKLVKPYLSKIIKHKSLSAYLLVCQNNSSI